MAVDQSAIAAGLTAQITAVNAVIETVGSIQDARPKVLATVAKAATDALAPFDAAIASYDAEIDMTGVGGVSASLPALQSAQALLAQAVDVTQQSRLVIARAFLARVAVNVNKATG